MITPRSHRVFHGLSRFLLLPALAAALHAEPVGGTEKVLPEGLTAEQRAGLILEPKFSDAFFGQVDRQYLNGFWKFRPELNLLRRQDAETVVSADSKPTTAPESDAGLTEGYFKPEFDASGWEEIPVPWGWNIAIRPDSGKATKRIAFAGLGYYRTTFVVPEDKRGQRVVLHFEQVQTECQVWLNGVLVGEHRNSSPHGGPYWDFHRRVLLDDFQWDVTDHVVFGSENTLVLRVFDDGLPIEDGIPNDGGILGSVWMDFLNPIHFEEMLVDADPNGDVTILARALNHTDAEARLPVTADVTPFQSASYTPPPEAKPATVALGEVVFPKGESEHRFSFQVPNPIPWDVNRPSLYRLRLNTGDTLLGQTRIGFRRMEVRGKEFFLNGRPITLRGVNPGVLEYTQSRLWAFNRSDWLREGFRLYKDANLNLRRTNAGPDTFINYDLCDELGILKEEDFSLETRALSLDDANATAALIAESKVDGITNSAGELTPFGKSILRKWLVRLHNHPSVCFLTGGNEIGFHGKEKELGDYMTAFYHYIKSIDQQKRPITPSSGLTIWQWNTPLPADFLDYHDYQNGDMGYMDCSEPTGAFAHKHLTRIFGSLDKPIVLGEIGAYQSNLTLRSDIQALEKDGVLDRKAYVKWANAVSSTSESGNYWNFLPRMMFVNFAGIRSATSREALVHSTAKLYSELIRRLRRDTDYLQGLVVHDLDPSHWGIPVKNVFLTADQVRESAVAARQNPEFLAEREALAPLAALPDLHDRNRFAGESLDLQILLLNNQYATPEKDLVVEVSLLADDGTSLDSKRHEFADVPENSRTEQVLTLTIPSDTPTGNYKARVRLLRGDAVVQETSTPLYVRSPKDDATPIKTSAKVALYERSGIDKTRRILDSLQIAYTPVESLKDLGAYQVLLIGANSFDRTLTAEADAIKSWLENGGRILCLEQKKEGPVPFAPEITVKNSGDMLFADVIDAAHPILAGLKPSNWEVWNGKTVRKNGGVSAAKKAIYTHYLTPIQDGVILSGGNRSQFRFGKNPAFGMVAGTVPVGKGSILFSQPLATSRFGTDPAATAYLRNLLDYAVNPQNN